MIDQIAIVASVMSAITAVTTSLRALGKSRELQREELESRIKTSGRVSGRGPGIKIAQSKNIFLHLVVTIIWIALSIACISLLWIPAGLPRTETSLLPWISAYIILILIICLIWFQVFRQRH
jgi:hypothetical protein